MVIYDFLNFRYLYFLPILGENQTVWMYQINSVLFLPVSLQRMASPDVTGNHHLNGICSAYFCDSLLNLAGHPDPILPFRFSRDSTVSLYLPGFVSYFQVSLSYQQFTCLVNLLYFFYSVMSKKEANVFPFASICTINYQFFFS